jgi:hypothetical protein
MFRPSRSHLQADIWNILDSIQIVCGKEIWLFTGFVYKSGLYIQFDLENKLKFKIIKIKMILKLNYESSH